MMLVATSKKEPDLIRLHWDQGGVGIDYVQPFKFVSPDVFVNIDRSDASKIYRVTRKLNIGISIDPNFYGAKAFFRFFSRGLKGGILMDSFESDALKTEAKCDIHGDAQTGLVASLALKKILKESGLNEDFLVNDDVYSYDSIGVAANGRYAGVDHREGNPYYNKSSHFEIKFRRTSPPKIGAPEVEFLCLNMHLTAKATFKFESALERLKLGLRLFREELGIAPRTYRGLQTQLQNTFEVTLENYREKGFGRYLHEASREALDRYKKAKAFARPAERAMLAEHPSLAPLFAAGGTLADAPVPKTVGVVFEPGKQLRKYSAVAASSKPKKPVPPVALPFLGLSNFPALGASRTPR